MAKKKGTGTAKKLLEGLEPAGLVVTGMVRSAEADGDSLWFALPGSSKWVKLHADHIEEMKLVHTVRHGKQSLPLVNLVMKKPQSSEAQTYEGLAKAYSEKAYSDRAPAGPPGPTGLCYDSKTGTWGPCPKA